MEQLKTYGEAYGIALTDQMLQQFGLYQVLLLDWNSRINLTAITQPEEICIKHFLDSLMLLYVMDIPQGASIIDVGTGAGFPGVPLKIVRPDLKITLLDSLNKRVNFLQELSQQLGQQNKVVHGRAEEWGRKPEFRERYDIATARAVTNLPALCEYCLPFVKPDGVFVALKGPDVDGEIEASATALRLLEGQVEALHQLQLPGDNKRSVVIIKKNRQLSPKYPRNAVKITKSPL